ncbi:MAG TPA: biliverdin-producing heme oxygenase [Kofleriaceae bacterium]|nr:biliverdin-producing heme oxygenase [Kofleriaceae bacterium]
MPTSWMLTRLKRNAQSEHVAANIDRLSLLHVEAELARYRDYLIRIYGFEAPVEAALAATPGLDTVVDLGARSHLKMLRTDLAALGMPDVSGIRQCRNIPTHFTSVGEALGWIYVIEHNATLHGQVRRHLHKRIGAQHDSYLLAGERSGSTRVQELGAVLDRFAREPDTARQVVEAVKLAFRRQRQWFTQAMPPGDIRPTRVA